MTTNHIPLPAIDRTGNTLSDFDIALSISENAVNTQLTNAWVRWVKGVPAFRDLRLAPCDAGSLQARFSQPVISFNLDGQGPADVGMCFPFSSGKVVTPDGDTIDLAGWELRYPARLTRRDLDQDELLAIDDASGEKAAALIDHAALPPGAFSIECLFLDLTALRHIGAEAFAPGASVRAHGPLPAAAVACVRTALVAALEGKEILLHTLVFPRQEPRKSTFALRQFAHKITRNRAEPRASTLDYLGVFWKGRTMPSPLEPALSRLQQPWLDHDRTNSKLALVQGVMTLAGDKISDCVSAGLAGGLAQTFAKMNTENEQRTQGRAVNNPALELAWPEAALLREMDVGLDGGRIVVRQNGRTNHYEWKEDNLDYRLDKRLELTLTPQPGAGYRVDGKIVANFRRTRNMWFGITSDAKASMTTPITGMLQLKAAAVDDANGKPVGFNITPALDIDFGEPQDSADGNIPWYSLPALQLLNWWDKGEAKGYAGDARAAVRQMLVSAMGGINIQLDKLAIIPPGEAVFTFQAPRFTQAGDLMLDVEYIAALAQPRPAAVY